MEIPALLASTYNVVKMYQHCICFGWNENKFYLSVTLYPPTEVAKVTKGYVFNPSYNSSENWWSF